MFAWVAYEAPRVDLNFICHHLNVNPSITPRRQPPRRPSKEHVEAVENEVTKLKQAGAIKEVFYPQWLANRVVGKRKRESGTCVWTLQISIRLVPKTFSLYLR